MKPARGVMVVRPVRKEPVRIPAVREYIVLQRGWGAYRRGTHILVKSNRVLPWKDSNGKLHILVQMEHVVGRL